MYKDDLHRLCARWGGCWLFWLSACTQPVPGAEATSVDARPTFHADDRQRDAGPDAVVDAANVDSTTPLGEGPPTASTVGDFVSASLLSASALGGLWSERIRNSMPFDWGQWSGGQTYQPARNAIAENQDGKYVPIPGHAGYYINRRVVGWLPICEPRCAEQYGLAISRIGPANRYLTIGDAPILDPSQAALPDNGSWSGIPIQGGAYYLNNAYDPDVVFYAGRLWLAFEAGLVDGAGEQVFGVPGIAVAPLDYDASSGFSVAAQHIRVLLRAAVPAADAAEQDKRHLSASVPKFLVHRGELFIYWTAVTIVEGVGFESLRTRGMQLVHQAAGHTLLPSFASDTIASDDPRAHDVWIPDPHDATANRVADVYQLVSDGTFVYAIGALGGSPPDETDVCIEQRAHLPGCYRVGMSRSYTPLGERIFNREVLPEGVLYGETHAYSGLFSAPDSLRLLLTGSFITRGRGDYEFKSFPLPALPTGSDHAHYVAALYRDLLGRPARTMELDHWLGHNKRPAPQAAAGIAGSAEAHSRVVAHAHQTYLERPVPQADTAGDLRLLQLNGYEALVDRLVGTQVFKAAHPVCGVYCDANWRRANLIAFYYQSLLKRSPTAEELAEWERVYNTGWQNVAIELAASAEYRNRVETFEPAAPLQYVDALFRALTGRAASAADIESWSGKNQRVAPDAAAGIAALPEAMAKIVEYSFETYLGRAPDAGGLVAHTAVLVDQGYDAMIEGIIGSDEFHAKRPVDCEATLCSKAWRRANFVGHVFSALLKRPPSSAELARWLQVYENTGWQSVPIQLAKSTEFMAGLRSAVNEG